MEQSLKKAQTYAESIDEIKTAWQEKEAALNARIYELMEKTEQLEELSRQNTQLKYQADIKEREIAAYKEKIEGMADIEILKNKNLELRNRK
ncbi:hypothetical protein [Desulfonatronospira sp.]|uniref:hypothetical protein n=1 Tax=Desulfonatronospira sp. TaxID=1962951 RepID=UPI0025C4D111|nr:hypothetical protein [Desulfonatronospira sp.]